MEATSMGVAQCRWLDRIRACTLRFARCNKHVRTHHFDKNTSPDRS